MGSIEADSRADARVEVLTAADAEAVFPLSVEAGWNQTVADWRFMLGVGEGFGVRDSSGRWAGSAIALPLGPALSWLCMVLVARRRRRRGIGTRLLQTSIDAVRSRGAVAGLDATELGRPVYLPLGFRDLLPISRWRLDRVVAPEPASPGCMIRRLQARDLPAVIAFDEPRSAMRRGHVLRYLFASAPDLAFIAENDGRLVGYGLGRPGRVAAQIGPVVADDEEAALALIGHGMAATEPGVLLDVPDRHHGLAGWLGTQRATRERGFVRMILGDREAALAEAEPIFALAGAELG